MPDMPVSADRKTELLHPTTTECCTMPLDVRDQWYGTSCSSRAGDRRTTKSRTIAEAPPSGLCRDKERRLSKDLWGKDPSCEVSCGSASSWRFADVLARRYWPLLAGCVLYIAQGLLKIAGLPLEYLIKDTSGASPAVSQALSAVVQLPWLAKPCLGLLVDFMPICGSCSRGAYLLVAGALIALGWAWLCAGGETASTGIGVTIALFTTATGVALSDVIADGLICTMGRQEEKGKAGASVTKLLAAARGCKTVGQMLGEGLGGALVQSLGPRITLGASAVIIPSMVAVAGGFLMADPGHAERAKHQPSKHQTRSHKSLSSTWQTALANPRAVQVALALLLIGVALNPGSALFYFYTSPAEYGGLAFGPAFVGQLRTGMAAARAAALLMNATLLASLPSGRLLECTCMAGAAVGLLQTFIVTCVPMASDAGLGWLAGLGMVVTSLALAAVVRVAGIVALGMAAKICCELGGEAATFSVFMSVWNGSHILGKVLSSALMAAVGISAHDLSSMPWLMAICSASMLLPMLAAEAPMLAGLRIRRKTA